MLGWLPPPESGARVCGGFDGSTSDDWTGIRLETFDGFQFTPRFGPDRRPAIWNPAEHGGRVPRAEVHAAWSEIHATFDVERVYYDPPQWVTEGEQWSARYGTFVPWETSRAKQMHAALDRFYTDLGIKAFRHDGCPVTRTHVLNARKLPRGPEAYVIGKPSQTQKIDLCVCSVLAHEAAADARSKGWGSEPSHQLIHFR